MASTSDRNREKVVDSKMVKSNRESFKTDNHWKFVISIEGGQAVGKTTLADRLKSRFPDIHVEFENPSPIVKKRKSLGLDITTKRGFIENQRLFIEAEMEKFHKLPKAMVILDCGPEAVESYAINYPKSIGADWNVADALSNELANLRKCRSDRILYLQAANDTLRSRNSTDKIHNRGWFEHYIEKLHPLEEAWFLALPQTEVIRVDQLNSDEVEKSIAEWLDSKWNK